MKSFTSSFSSSSSSSSPLYSDRQFCLTGLQAPLELCVVPEEIGGRKGPGKARMLSEGQYIETGSDSDSGNGTVFSDNLESPTRESPFSNDRSQVFASHGNSKDQRAEIREKEALYEAGIESENNFEDDGFPLSPTSEVSYNFRLENPSEDSSLSEGSRQMGSGSVYRMEKLHHDVIDPRLDYVTPKIPNIPDKNNNNSKSRDCSSTSHYGSGEQCSPVATKSDQRHLSNGDGKPGFRDSKELLTNSCDDFNVMRPKLQAKCHDLYGIRSNGFGSREICPRHGSRQDIDGSHADETTRDVRVGYDSDRHRDARTLGHDRRALETIQCGNTVRLNDVTRTYDSQDLSLTNSRETIRDASPRDEDDRHSEISYGRHLSLNDSLSTVYTDLSLCSSSSEAQARRYVRHQLTPHHHQHHHHHTGTKHWGDSPSRGGCRYAKRCKETSFNSPMGSDPQLSGDGRGGGGGGGGAGGGGGGGMDGSPRRMNPAEYRRFRSASYECAAGGTWTADRHDCLGVLGLHPAMQQPFSEEVPATLPRPNKPGARTDGSSVVVVADRTKADGPPRKQHHGRPARRWTNPGLSEADAVKPEVKPEVNHVPSNPKSSRTSGRSSTGWLSLSSILKPKKHSSTTSLASEARPDLGSEFDGSEVASTRSAATRPSSSMLSVFEMANLEASKSSSVPTTPIKNERSLRDSTVRDPGGRSGSSGISLIQMIRSRFSMTSKRKNSSTVDDVTSANATVPRRNGDGTDHVTHGQDQHSVGCVEIRNDVISVAKATGKLSRFHSLQEESPNDKEFGDQTKNFATLQPQKTKTGNQGGEFSNHEPNACPANRKPTAAASPYNAAPPGELIAPPGEVNVVRREVDEFITNVDAYAASRPETDERTILEEDFNEYKQNMIESLKYFIDQCKLMVIKTPASYSGFLDALSLCRRLLGGVFDRFRALVDCTSLPTDRVRFAGGINAVAVAFRETVAAASETAGRTARDPGVKRLRVGARQLVDDLTKLMKMIREMNYNRLSRRF